MPPKFQGSCIVFKYFTVDIRSDTNDLEVCSLISCSKFMTGMTSRSVCDMAMYSAFVVESVI
jgi:hypothetical protein